MFIILIFFKNKGVMKIPGLISGIFLFFYSIFRFSIEFLRVPDEQLGYLFLNLTMGQYLSLLFLFIGSYLIIKKMKSTKSSKIPLDKFIDLSLYDKKSATM